MDPDTLIDAIDSNGRRLLEAAGTDLDAAVPGCGDWTTRDLVVHVGQVHGWITEAIHADSLERPTHGFPHPGDDDPLEWGHERLMLLLAALRSADPDRPVWTWGDDHTVGWYIRRMAHETVVHRYDAEAAIGEVTAIDSDLACDGVDELTQVGMRRSANPKKSYDYPEGSLHLHRTDGDGEWLLRTEDGQLVVTREHAKGDVAVRGAAPDLLLYLWGRSRDNLEIFGDEDLAWEWAAVAP